MLDSLLIFVISAGTVRPTLLLQKESLVPLLEVLLEVELKTPAGENPGDEGRRYDRVEGGRRGKGRGVHLRLCDPLRLRPPVLEPDLDLRLRDVQAGCELRPLGDAEVGLGQVLLLQPVQLLVGERGPRLPVRPVLPQGALERQVGHGGEGGSGGERLRWRKVAWRGSCLLQLLQKQQLGEGGGEL